MAHIMRCRGFTTLFCVFCQGLEVSVPTSLTMSYKSPEALARVKKLSIKKLFDPLPCPSNFDLAASQGSPSCL